MNKELEQKIDLYLDQNREAIINDLCDLVRYPSISDTEKDDTPFGVDCANVLEEALKKARSYGLSATNYNNYYGIAEYGRGDKKIGIFSHLDVVPAGNGWNSDPFNAVKKGKYLIGRGVVDNKGAAVLGLHIMNFFRTTNTPLNSKISLYFGCSEETGMEDIAAFVREQPMPEFSIVPDTNFPVCHGEKGILGIDARANICFKDIICFEGGLASNMVPDSAYCKLPYTEKLYEEIKSKLNEDLTLENDSELITITARGMSRHASEPDGAKNAIAVLSALVKDLDINENDKKLMDIVNTTSSSCHGEPFGIDVSDEPSGKLTCICGVARTKESNLSINFDIRYPVTTKGEEHIDKIKAYFDNTEFSVIATDDSAPAYLPKDDPKVQALCDIYAELTGKDATPYVMGGGTYSRCLKNAIGFGMESGVENPDFPEGHGGVHQPDEALDLNDYFEAFKIYVYSIVKIDTLIS